MAALLVPDRAAGDLEGQVHRALRDRILRGLLRPGERLPSTRALASTLGVARATVVQAYERLRAEGFLEARPGAASVVAAAAAAPVGAGPGLAPRPAPLPEPGPAPPLTPGVPDTSGFPHAVWARLLGARARGLRRHELGYGDAAGMPALRRALLAHLAPTRGVAADPSQLVVLPSTRAAIGLLAGLLLRPGEGTVWMEDPGYATAVALLRAAGGRLAPVPCDAGGMDPGRAAAGPPRLIYVTPSHQYPTGVTMTLARRLAVLEAARAAGAVVLEDDYDSEFQFDGRPIAALQGIDRHGVVAYLGTMSKVLAPGLGVAYAVLPPALAERAAAAIRLQGMAVPVHVQAALTEFLADGHLRAHVRRMTPLYAARMAAFAAALRQACGEALVLGPGAGGLQLAAWFADPRVDDRAMVRALAARGLGVQALSAMHLGEGRPGLLFGIARAEAAEAGAVGAVLREAGVR